MWNFDQSAFERLSSLMSVVSPSMDETGMASYLRECWRGYGLIVDTDVMGNLHASKKGVQDIDVAVCAHMDTVAVQISNILPNGMLQFRRIGLSPHVLLGQRVKIKTAGGLIDGVVGFDPTSQYGQPKGLVEEDLWIDICACSRNDAEQYVKVGDLAVLDHGLRSINQDFLCSPGLDDRVGVFVMQECMRWFGDREAPVNLHFIATVQEEVGLRGASVISAGNEYDACIVLDVDYATDTPASHENQMGALRLGGGVGLHMKADNNPVLRRIAAEAAQRNDIRYQVSLGRFFYGGTDSAPMQLKGRGHAVANFNIPCRYMHSPVEICHRRDVEAAVNLLIETVEEIGRRQSGSFIPGID